MRICFICEGSYPYVAGGVSSWLHDLIQKMPEHEVVIWTIGANESMRGKFVYELPGNVIEVKEAFLDTVMYKKRDHKKRVRFKWKERKDIRTFLECGDPNWDVVFDAFSTQRNDPMDFMVDHIFLDMLKVICDKKYPFLPFTDFFWTMRGMFLPVLHLMHGEIPEADIYHAVSCGYAGVLGAAASKKYDRPLIVTEHGIYTREREEEILRASWVQAQYKPLWIKLFYMFSKCAYDNADVVTSLFGYASQVQADLGCDKYKQLIIPNGVNTEVFGKVPRKKPDGFTDVGAIVRIVPIKDIKTMLYAFYKVIQENPNVRLHILGPTDENPEYYEECEQLRKELGLDNVIFTGRVNTAQYLQNIDFTLLTSISEGMPLAILEGMTAGRAAVVTNVGSCPELVHGNGDDFGDAGYVVSPMDPKAVADAILKLASDEMLIRSMGNAGRKRARKYFRHSDMIERYRQAYEIAIKEHDRKHE